VSTFQIVPVGDATLVVEFEERIDPAVNARAVATADALRSASIAGVRDVVPTYRSVAVYFDPLLTDHSELMRRLEEAAAAPPRGNRQDQTLIRVPVCYGGDFGPDLKEIAGFAQATEAEVVELHTARTYRVFMLGFMPGFAYMGMVDSRIAVPRREVPRVRVPRGSVCIAGVQTSVHPVDAPSGWHLIGRTPVRPFDLQRPDPFLLKPADEVQFYSIDRQEFARLDRPHAS
jgi:KipI family sensor histidine kinase inhibitor